MRCYCLVAAVVAVSGVLLVAGGCGKGGWSAWNSQDRAPSGSAGLSGVAVVDLDEVAKQLGTDVVLKKAISDGQVSLNQQLKTLQSTLQDKYRQKAQELEAQPGVKGSGETSQKSQVAELERELNLQLNQARRTAQNELSTYRQRLIQRFRDEVTPVAQQVAGERGLGVVVTKNDSVLLAYDNAHDITAAVVARLRAHQAARPQEPATANRSAAPTDPRR